jgi:hypothetical protein
MGLSAVQKNDKGRTTAIGGRSPFLPASIIHAGQRLPAAGSQKKSFKKSFENGASARLTATLRRLL